MGFICGKYFNNHILIQVQQTCITQFQEIDNKLLEDCATTTDASVFSRELKEKKIKSPKSLDA